jgi:hypothetical protein
MDRFEILLWSIVVACVFFIVGVMTACGSIQGDKE